MVGNLRPDRNLIFFVAETIHRGELPGEVPAAVLRVGEEEYFPAVSDGPSLVEHHRLSVYSFPKRAADGTLIDIEGAGRMRLYVSNRYLGSARPMTFVGSWDAPYSLPEELRSRADITRWRCSRSARGCSPRCLPRVCCSWSWCSAALSQGFPPCRGARRAAPPSSRR